MVVKNTTEEEESPNGFLYALEIENFKSFKLKHYIGPFRDFTAIIGPNGSGKSNLMDAISFVLGERSNNLRVRKLGDLIHGASVEKAEVNKCRVSMIFALDREDRENGPKKTFTRSVVSSTASEFRIDNEVVTPNDYRKALEEIYIFIKAKNFLVYQGAVERVAMQNPKELTQLFEELSRSSELKSDYEKAKSDLQSAEANAQTNMIKRRDIAMEKREARLEKDEARKYQTLKDELAAKNKELYLVQLYFVEHSRSNAQNQLELLKDQVEEIRKTKSEFEERVAEKQAVVKNLSREIQKMDQKITKEERKYANQEPRCNQLKQKIEHIKAKLASVEKAYKSAQKVAEEYDRNVAETEGRMNEFRKQKQALEQQIAQESQKMELNLNPEQVAEYRRLKGEVEKRGNIINVELDNKTQEQETDRNAVEYEKRRLVNFSERVKQKEMEIAREKKNMENLKESEEAQRQLIETETQNLKTLEQDVRSAKERLSEVTIQLDDITKQISDAQGDSAETERNRRQNEAIENLKRVFPDRVHGRLIELCQPSHRRFQVAVTKVLGKFMVAIVCDTDDTARECITYLREQHYPPETFLPLNSLEVMPINEKLRDIRDPPNVKLLYDVIQCNFVPAKKALQFVCGNSLVCDDPEHARMLAYGGGDSRDRYRAVSLDGTQFQPNGVISGGGHDLKVRAKRWDEHQMKKLRDKRAELQEEYNHLHRTRRRELDVEMKRNQISQIEQRIKFTQMEYKRISTHLERLSREIETDHGEIEAIQSKISSREEEMEKRLVDIERLEEQNNLIADEVFAEFCTRVGIRHIREYEQRELRIHEENEQKINACTRELQRLRYEMEFLKSEDKKGAVKKEADKLEQLKGELEEARESYSVENDKLQLIQRAMDELKREVVEKRKEIEEAETEVATVKKDGGDIDKQLHQVEKNLIQQEQIVSRRTQKRHSLLQECKLHGIDIPLSSGTLDTILLTDEFSSIDDSQGLVQSQSQQSSSQQSQVNADEIVVNYSSLKGPMKALQNEAEVKKISEKLTKAVQETEATLSKMAAPSTHVNERMEIVKEKEAETSEECEQARRKTRKARATFEKIKTDRLKRFQEFFDPVAAKIDEIYKALSQNESAQAFLGMENCEEPYNGGISYSCIAPGKRFRPMDNLSGGEKTIAALALLFAIHASNPSPFFVLDEIDAALDNTNIGKVVSYICDRSKSELQIIVISLKEEMYNKSNALIGVYPKNTVPCIASGILSYDLDELENQ